MCQTVPSNRYYNITQQKLNIDRYTSRLLSVIELFVSSVTGINFAKLFPKFNFPFDESSAMIAKHHGDLEEDLENFVK